MSRPIHRHQLHTPASLADRLADRVADAAGSWTFIWSYLGITAGWMIGNANSIFGFDPYPFIAYTCAVSVLAILMTALVLLSQNRQARKDRARDDLEAQEVDLLLQLNHRQLEILTTLHNLIAEEGAPTNA